MGIDVETARFLLGSRKQGTSFQQCATLGRQNYSLSNRETADLLKEYGFQPEQYPKLFPDSYSASRYAEPFWEVLGAQQLDTIDASDFEGATRVHDMSFPVPPDWKGKYDAVCDFGTLEHVFNFPTALRNCMEMLKVGGHFLAQTPVNNYVGHGFYQFSPELFFRVFSERSGFQTEVVIAVSYGLRRKWFLVSDPLEIKARVTTLNSSPMILFVRARKTADVPLFREFPQQAQYMAQWAREATDAQSKPVDVLTNARLDPLKRALLGNAPRLARALEALRYSVLNSQWTLRNRRNFSPISKRAWGKEPNGGKIS